MQPAATLSAPLAWRAARAAGQDAQDVDAPPRVPGYRMVRPVARGRRSTVWLAWDLARQAEVALKVAPRTDDALQREAAIAARVQHPRLVRVLAQGRTSEHAWLAFEHVPGGELARRFGRPLPREDALSLLRQAAEALAQLHRQGLVHRDVKPANFLLRADGGLVLADLGLVAEAGTAAAPGALFGTPRYVAPEQLQGAGVQPAADVYSLGVLLHEMLCGRPPFSGETLMEVLAQHLLAEPARLPAEAADLQPLVDRMLCKEVQSRLPDGDAVLGRIGQRC
jgi:serine/threonine protein kinase